VLRRRLMPELVMLQLAELYAASLQGFRRLASYEDAASRGFMRTQVDIFQLVPLPVAERLRMPCLDSQEVSLRGRRTVSFVLTLISLVNRWACAGSQRCMWRSARACLRLHSLKLPLHRKSHRAF